MKERFRHCIIFIFIISFSGFVYGIFYKKTGIGIPCLFYEITGLYCPGCGITRMMVSLLEGNIVEAISFNHVIFFMMPLFLWICCALIVRYIKTGNKMCV